MCWVHPIIGCRSTKGAFPLYMLTYVNNPRIFFSFARMSVSSFDEIAQLLQGHLKREDTRLRKSVSPEEKHT